MFKNLRQDLSDLTIGDVVAMWVVPTIALLGMAVLVAGAVAQHIGLVGG